MISLPHRRRFLHLCATGLGSATLPTLAEGQRPASESEKSPAELITPEARTAIDRGLTFLTRKQVKSGKLAGAFGTSGYAAGTAVTGLGGLGKRPQLGFLGTGVPRPFPGNRQEMEE